MAIKFRGPGWEKGIARVQKKIDRTHKEYLTKIVAAAKALTDAKDNRGKMEKEVDLLQKNYGLTKQAATDLWRSDDSLKEKLRAYAEYIKAAPLDIQMDAKAMDDYNNNALKLFGLDKPTKPGGPKQGIVEQDPNNPLGLKTPTAEDYNIMQQ